MIFVSTPYYHPDSVVVQDRVRILSHYCGKLLKEGKWNVSPITHGTTITKHIVLPMDFEFWQHISFEMINVCKEMHVLMMEGWKQSIGVIGEISHAKKKKIPIKYIEVSINKSDVEFNEIEYHEK